MTSDRSSSLSIDRRPPRRRPRTATAARARLLDSVAVPTTVTVLAAALILTVLAVAVALLGVAGAVLAIGGAVCGSSVAVHRHRRRHD